MKKLNLIVGLIVLITIKSFGADRYWVRATAGNWNVPGNWSSTSNGPGGAGVPGPSDFVYFDGASGLNGSCSLSGSVTVQGISISGYTGSLDLNGFALTLTTTPSIFNTGTVTSSVAGGNLVLSNSLGANSLTVGGTAIIGVPISGSVVSFIANSGSNFSGTSINLTTGTSTFNGGTFSGTVTISSSSIFLNGAVFNSAVALTKTGSSVDQSKGGNNFNSSLSLTLDVNASAMYLGVNSADVFSFVTLRNNSTLANPLQPAAIYLAHSSAGNLFRGSLYIVSNTNPSANYNGIYFGLGGGTSTLLSGQVINLTGGFSAGTLQFANFTQSGNGTFNLNLNAATGNQTVLWLGPSSSWGGAVNGTAAVVNVQSSVFNKVTSLTKSGTDNVDGAGINGGNTFVQAATLNLTSSGGNWYFGETASDLFNDVTVNNAGTTSRIYLANKTGLTNFNGNITLSNSSTGGIYFGNSFGSSKFIRSNRISISGSYSQGSLSFTNFQQQGGTPQALTLTGSAKLSIASCIWSAGINFVAPSLVTGASIYAGPTYLEMTGSTNVGFGIGGNTFNGTTTLVGSGNGDWYFGYKAADTFNGDLIANVTGTSNNLYLSSIATGNKFNGNILVTSSSTGGLTFGQNGGTSTLASGNSIQVGSSGFSNGTLGIYNFTQLGSTPQSLALSGSSVLKLQNALWGGNVNFVAPSIFTNSSTYNGATSYLEVNGSANTGSTGGNGGNVFSGVTTLVKSGSGGWYHGYDAPDNFKNDVILSNTGGTNSLCLAHVAPGTTFNGNITINKTDPAGPSGSVYFGFKGGSSILANTKTISIGGTGFSRGTLGIFNFAQQGGTKQTLNLSGAATLSLINSSWAAKVRFVAPILLTNTTAYGLVATDSAYLEATGATDTGISGGIGGNTFNGVTTLVRSGNGGWYFGYDAADIFQNDLILSSIGGSNPLAMAHTASGTQFNGNITINKSDPSGPAGSVYFGFNGGSSTLADQKKISVGSTGFSSGTLAIFNFTQIGNTLASQQKLQLTGSSTILSIMNTKWGAKVNFVAPLLLTKNTIYGTVPADSAYLEGTGSTNAGVTGGIGGNTFNGVAKLVRSGTGGWYFGYDAPDIFQNDLILSSTGGTFSLCLAHTAAGTKFNGNIFISKSDPVGPAGSVYFGYNGGSATLAANKTISVGTFSSGTLGFYKVNVVGGTPQSILLTGTTTFLASNSVFNGGLSVTAPSILLNNSTFNGINSFTKTGTSTDQSQGGNSFSGATTFTNSSTGSFGHASTVGDSFTSAVTYIQSGAGGTILPAQAGTTTYVGDIIINSPSTITFGANGGGVASFIGNGGVQNISITGTGSVAPTFNNIILNTSNGGQVNLSNTIVNIGSSATFTKGVLNSTANNYLNFMNGATTSGASNASYVEGPVRKTGKQAFTFPVGNAGFYRAISISAPVTTNDFFTAQFFRGAQTFGGGPTYQSPILIVSSCEYWILNRGATTTANVNVTLSWNTPDCSGPTPITNPSKLVVGRWNGTNWVSQGNGGTTGNITSGTIITSAPVTSFSPFALASTVLTNPLPITLKYFDVKPVNSSAKIEWQTASEVNNDFFSLERSADGKTFEKVASIKGAGTSKEAHTYTFVDNDPMFGESYYRLSQNDIDGVNRMLSIANFKNSSESQSFEIFPNPAYSTEKVKSNFSGSATIYNSIGQIVLQVQTAAEIDISSLEAGFYVIKVSNGSSRHLVIR